MLLNDIDNFNIGSQKFINTSCNHNMEEIQGFYTQDYGTSNNIHYIDIKTFGDKTYKLSVVLSDKVVEYMHYKYDFTASNDTFFLFNSCRLLKKMEVIIKKMCKNLNENCIEYIATISEDINGLVEFLHYDAIRCIYLYYDDESLNLLNNKNPDHNNSKLNITDNFCDFCPYKNINIPFNRYTGHSCNNQQYDIVGFTNNYKNNFVIKLYDIYNQNENIDNNYCRLVYKFAHNIIYGLENCDTGEKNTFDIIFDNYYQNFLINQNQTNKSILSLDNIELVTDGSTGNWNKNYLSIKFFAMASVTWFNCSNNYTNINTKDEIKNNFYHLYEYLERIYGFQENIKFSGDTNTYTNTDSFRFKYLIPIAMALGIGGIGYSVRKCAAYHNRNYQTCDDLESQP